MLNSEGLPSRLPMKGVRNRLGINEFSSSYLRYPDNYFISDLKSRVQGRGYVSQNLTQSWNPNTIRASSGNAQILEDEIENSKVNRAPRNYHNHKNYSNILNPLHNPLIGGGGIETFGREKSTPLSQSQIVHSRRVDERIDSSGFPIEPQHVNHGPFQEIYQQGQSRQSSGLSNIPSMEDNNQNSYNHRGGIFTKDPNAQGRLASARLIEMSRNTGLPEDLIQRTHRQINLMKIPTHPRWDKKDKPYNEIVKQKQQMEQENSAKLERPKAAGGFGPYGSKSSMNPGQYSDQYQEQQFGRVDGEAEESLTKSIYLEDGHERLRNQDSLSKPYGEKDRKLYEGSLTLFRNERRYRKKSGFKR